MSVHEECGFFGVIADHPKVTCYFGDSIPESAYIVITGTSGVGYCNSYIRNITVN